MNYSFGAAFCCAPYVLIAIVLVSMTEFGLLYLPNNVKKYRLQYNKDAGRQNMY